jgi:pSer/pThr/pTyr-binding forkhead associated (FHA) protein
MKFIEKEDTTAFAKIEGKEFKFFMNKPTVYIGRDVASNSNNEEQAIYLGNYKFLSRRHLKIFWDPKKRSWFIQNLSKNIIFVNKEKLSKDQKPKKLKVISPIKVGVYKFYFFRAKPLSG